MSIRRPSTIAAAAILAVPLCIAGLAWACAPSNWGWTQPSAPQATEVAPSAAPAAQAPAAAPAAQAGGSASAAKVTQVAEQPVSTSTATARSGATASATRSAAPARTPAARTAPRNGAVTSRARATAQVARATPAAAPARAQRAARPASSRRRPTAAEKSPARALTSAEIASARGWEGIASTASPGLLPRAAQAAPQSGGDGRLLIGAGLLSIGLVGLFGGFATLELRRRRAGAGRRDRGAAR